MSTTYLNLSSLWWNTVTPCLFSPVRVYLSCFYFRIIMHNAFPKSVFIPQQSRASCVIGCLLSQPRAAACLSGLTDQVCPVMECGVIKSEFNWERSRCTTEQMLQTFRTKSAAMKYRWHVVNSYFCIIFKWVFVSVLFLCVILNTFTALRGWQRRGSPVRQHSLLLLGLGAGLK